MWEINTLQMVLIFESRTEIPKLLLSFTESPTARIDVRSCIQSQPADLKLKWAVLSARLISILSVEILTLQSSGINEMDGAGDTDTHADLTHVPQALCQPW